MRSQDDFHDKPRGLSAADREKWLADLRRGNALAVDLRPPESFAAGFLPGSLNVPSTGCLAGLAGGAFFEGREVFFVSEEERAVLETSEFFQRLGYPAPIGWFGPAILSRWQQRIGPLGKIEEIPADNLAVRLAAWKTLALDVRGLEESRTVRIPESIHIPLDRLLSSMLGMPTETNLTVVCSTGEHASLAASLLWRMGYHNVSTLTGGIASYVRRGLRVVS